MQSKIKPFGEKYNIVIPGDYEKTIDFCSEHFFSLANEAIEKRGNFFVALSGGSTPKAMYERLALPKNANRADWSKVKIFWGDERPVPPTHPDSNYKMAMDAAFSKLPVPEANIFRITAE
ncbi:MAG: 6-phosphogluconolactonase, partial [Chlamydiales bacterium]